MFGKMKSSRFPYEPAVYHGFPVKADVLPILPLLSLAPSSLPLYIQLIKNSWRVPVKYSAVLKPLIFFTKNSALDFQIVL